MMDIVLLGIDAGIKANMDMDLLIEFGNIIAINSPQFLCRKAKIVVIEFDNTPVSEMSVPQKMNEVQAICVDAEMHTIDRARTDILVFKIAP
jgi:hypothetical protein